jgi:hypothetical protein
MAKKKAKWLEGNTLSIVEAMVAALTAEEVTEVQTTKALKGAEELKERFALESSDPTVESILAKASAAVINANELIDQAGALYKADVDAAGDNEEDVDSESEEIPAPVKEKKSKKAKKSEKVEDAVEVDYASMSKKALRELAKENGLKVNKKMEKEEIIEILESAK